MIEAKFKLGDEAVMMYNNEPVRVFVMERFFVKREYESKFLRGDVTSFDYGIQGMYSKRNGDACL